ncbi:MAG: hypothetical protein ACO3C1_09390 [Ilumatobacteraceae bacterium]
MSLQRFRLPRRRPRLHIDSNDHEWSIFLPDPDDPLVVAGMGEASILATEVVDLPVRREVLALLDEHRRVTALLLDAPAEFALFVGHAARAGLPGLDAPFCQTLLLVIDDEVADDAPTADQRAAYRAIQRAHMAQGLQLLDVILTDGDRVRSVSCACDAEPVWFDEFVPADDADGDDSA